MKYNIPFIKPTFPSASEVAEDYEKIVESNWFTNFGLYERDFSKKAAGFIAQDIHISTVSNATLGLLIAIRLLFDRGDKRKVLVPSFTFAAGPEMLIASNLTPVFIDIQRDNWQPNLTQARKYIESNRGDMAGILLCNIFGVGGREVSKWEDLAEEFNLPLIIDSAAGFGSEYEAGERIGARGDCEIFSLHATKPFAVGEGGLISSKDESFIRDVDSFQNFGFNQEKRIGFIGINAKLQELNAAIGMRQLSGLSKRLERRRESLDIYKEVLVGRGYVFQENDDLSTVPFVSVLAKTSLAADKALQALRESGVEARKYYEPLHTQRLLDKYSERAGDLSVTEDVYSRILSLPLHDSMTAEDIRFITNVITKTHE